MRNDEPGCQSETALAPKWYFARMTGSVIACQIRSGVALM